MKYFIPIILLVVFSCQTNKKETKADEQETSPSKYDVDIDFFFELTQLDKEQLVNSLEKDEWIMVHIDDESIEYVKNMDDNDSLLIRIIEPEIQESSVNFHVVVMSDNKNRIEKYHRQILQEGFEKKEFRTSRNGVEALYNLNTKAVYVTENPTFEVGSLMRYTLSFADTTEVNHTYRAFAPIEPLF